MGTYTPDFIVHACIKLLCSITVLALLSTIGLVSVISDDPLPCTFLNSQLQIKNELTSFSQLWHKSISSRHWSTSGLQIGFKWSISTTLCTGNNKNAVSRNVHEGLLVLYVFMIPRLLIWLKFCSTTPLDKDVPAYLTYFFFSCNRYKEECMYFRWRFYFLQFQY